MFGLSTSWKSKICTDGVELLNQIQETEIPGIELDYRLTVDTFKQMEKPLKKSGIKVLSVHNIFPRPEVSPPSNTSGDALLSSPDNDERKLAVKYGCRSIQSAHDLEAEVVVFHLGKVEIDWKYEEWLKLYDDGLIETSKGKEYIESLLIQRQAKLDKYLDAVFFSVEKLNAEAIKRNVKVGIENRLFVNRIPNLEEIGFLLQKFDGGNVGYWHDCGHAQIWENYGFAKHEQFLKNYSDKLIGIHLHDCKNGYDDHVAPGTGKIDFDMVKKYLPRSAVKIIEVHNKVSLSELREGVAFLVEKGIIE